MPCSRSIRALKAVDARLEQNQWLAGSEFTAADIIAVFSLTTMRVFMPMELADPGFAPMVG